VNRRMFELRQDRYEALVDLLIELRQPQLARQLDEGRLSNALSNALPRCRKRLSRRCRAMRGWRKIGWRSRTWSRQAVGGCISEGVSPICAILASRRSAEVRKAHSVYESRQRKLRERRALAIRQRNKASHCWPGRRSCQWSWQLRWERSRHWRAVPKCDPHGISMPPRNAPRNGGAMPKELRRACGVVAGREFCERAVERYQDEFRQRLPP